MLDILKLVPVPVLIGAASILVGLLGFVVVRAMSQGREVTFWPPRIGPALGGVVERAAPSQPNATPNALPSVNLKTRPIAWLRVSSGPRAGETFPLSPSIPTVTVGRGLSNQIVLDDPALDQTHCKLVLKPMESEGDGCLLDYMVTVVDCGSSGGTFVNGQRVAELELVDNDMVEVGGVGLVFKALGPTRH